MYELSLETLARLKSPINVIVRPILPITNKDYHADIIGAMTKCWEEQPEHRPNAGRVKNTIFAVTSDQL